MPVIISGDIKRKRPVKGKAVRPSKQIEMKARGWLKKLAKSVQTDVESITHLLDDPASAVSALGSLVYKYDRALDNGLAKSFSREWVESASMIEKAKLQNQLSNALGVDMTHILDDDATREAVLMAQYDAESLIVSVPRDYLGDISRAVLDNFQGKPLPEGVSLTDRIKEITGHNQYRARLIARDQTSKMTTALNQQRQQSVGIEEYIWRTAGDRRVVGFPGGYKPSKVHGNHYKMEGMWCKWSDSTVYSDDQGKTWEPRTGDMPKTQAGFDINCRCFSLPVIDPAKIKF